jgi:G3E family GTPase
MSDFLQNIPTNVITGFLGVGKTTAILSLLEQKPDNETWAVLVNEFGKVGIDGQLIRQDGVEIKEVPGGCMCCSGVSMQVGLNALVARARPDRLLIEPTGIGHPREIIKQLSQPPFDQLLDMRACITLVDPRHLSDERYLENEYYQEQLAIADVLVANKTDQSSEADKAAFDQLLKERGIAASGWVAHGRLDPAWLELPHGTQHRKSIISIPLQAQLDEELEAISLNAGETCRRIENHDKAYFSCGWLFSDATRFDYDAVMKVLKGIDAERIKATLKTDRGSYAFNGVRGAITITEKNAETENRLEIISLVELEWQVIETDLLGAIRSDN